MQKIILFILFSIFIVGCGDEPTPREKALLEIKAKLEAKQQYRFTDKNSKHIKVKKTSSEDKTEYIYKDDSLSSSEAKRWKELGISPTEYPKWAELNIDASEAKQWKKLGTSFASIKVFKDIEYTPRVAKKFLQRQFTSRPNFYKQFGTPVYELDAICETVIQRKQAPFAFLADKCVPYMKESHKNELMGHLIDEAEITKGPLALEYMANLRKLASKSKEIQSGMEVTIEEFIEDEDAENFVFLFPLLQNEPLQEEMDFIDANSLPLTNEERFFSFRNKEYWQRRAEAEEAVKQAAKLQEELLRAKKEHEKKAALARLKKAKEASKAKARAEEKYRQENIKRKKYAAIKEEELRKKKLKEKQALTHLENAKKTCGELIKKDQLSNKKVFIGGKIIFTVANAGDKMFGYGVQSFYDEQIYFIRDPRNLAKSSLSDSIVWKLKTMGRTEALSSLSADKFVYDKKSKTKFTMALILEKCEVK